jgi:hypothetical protein
MAETVKKTTKKSPAKTIKKTKKKEARKPNGKLHRRPTVVTGDVLKNLRQAFTVGATNLEACCRAGISEPTLYKYFKDNPEFSEEARRLKQSRNIQAKYNVLQAIKEGDMKVSMWALEKTSPEFSNRIDISAKHTVVHELSEEAIKHIRSLHQLEAEYID